MEQTQKNKELIESIEMNTQAIALLNKNLNDIAQQVKDIKVEMQGLRRNSGYLRNIAEIFQTFLKEYIKSKEIVSFNEEKNEKAQSRRSQ